MPFDDGKAIAKYSEAPLLQWWRLAIMTDAEILEFNSKFYVEIEMTPIKEMTDDNLDDTQQLIQSKGYQDALKEGLEAVRNSVGKSKSPNDCAEYMLLQARQKGKERWINIYAAQLGMVVSCGCEVRAITNDDVWNVAMEAAAKRCENIILGWAAKEIRKLKK